MEISRVLAIIDPTASVQPALMRAAEVAGPFGAALELFICDHEPVFQGQIAAYRPGLDVARKELEAEHRERLASLAETAAAELGDRAPPITADVACDHPLADGVLRKISQSRPDLVVKDTHYHGPIRRALFSNTDWELIRHCPRPLWLVKPKAQLASPRIVAAVAPGEQASDTDLDHRILRAAGALSERMGGELHVFHAYPAPALAVAGMVPGRALSKPMAEVQAETEIERRRTIDALLDGCGIDGATIALRAGSPAHLLLDYADQIDADLVVMGAVSRGMLERVVVGSTAEQTLDRLAGDLLVVK